MASTTTTAIVISTATRSTYYYQYDPYHHTTYSVLHPLGNNSSDWSTNAQKYLTHSTGTSNWRLSYQDFAPTLKWLDTAEVFHTQETFQ